MSGNFSGTTDCRPAFVTAAETGAASFTGTTFFFLDGDIFLDGDEDLPV